MGPFGLVGVSTTSLEGAHLVVVDLVVHLVAQRVGNFSDRPWGISVILVNLTFYNHQRRCTKAGGQSPIRYELLLARRNQVAA